MSTITGCKMCMERFIWLCGLLCHVAWWVCTSVAEEGYGFIFTFTLKIWEIYSSDALESTYLHYSLS
jgi:hypothetical protein